MNKGGMMLLIFTEDEIRDKVKINEETIHVIEEAFIDLAMKDVQMPPIMQVDIPEHNGGIDIKTAFIPGYEMLALKVSSGFFNNYRLGLPSTGGVVLLINVFNGQPEALLYDNGYLTDIRTATAGALAAKYLANDSCTKVGVIGAGAQARYQLMALKKVKSFTHVYIAGKSNRRLLDFKRMIESDLNVSAIICEDATEVAKHSELIITTTPATSPILQSEWIQQGTHITAIGSDAEHKNELDPYILEQATAYVCDVVAQCEILGELRTALQAGTIQETKNILELGDIIANKKVVRESEDDITIADLTGTGIQDTKIALYAYQKLTEEK